MEIFNNKENKVVCDKDWVKLIETPRGFFYLQRKNKNSVAVLLFDSNTKKVLVRFQPMVGIEAQGDSNNRMGPCPITGSIDLTDKTYLETAIRETREESGYEVSKTIKSTGSYLVSTQTDEICYTFIADVTGQTHEEPKGDASYFESISYNEWMDVESVYNLSNLYGGLIILTDQVLDEIYKNCVE